MKTVILLASLVALASSATVRPCEDAPIDCAAKDTEMQICDDPIDSMAYCPRYCGKCQGPTPVPTCHDFDKGCPALVNSVYCAKAIAKELCAKSCGLCGVSTTEETTTTTTTTTTTEAPTTTTPEPTTTPERFIEIIDPNCQDIDPNCITLLQKHYCADELVVRKLCQRSCNMCPLIQVPVTSEPGQPGETEPATQESVCRDYDDICAETKTVDQCSSDEVTRILCPLACGVCGPATTEGMEETTVGLPVLDTFTPNQTFCFNNDPDCEQLIQTHDCQTDQIVIRLCPASCNLCQLGTTAATGVTAPPAECRDYSVDCDKLQPSCSFDPLVVRLCRETCNAEPCPQITEGPTEPITPENPVTATEVTTTEVMTTAELETTTEEPEVTTEMTPAPTEPEVETTVEEVVTTAAPVVTTAAPVVTSLATLPALNPENVTNCVDQDPQCDLLVKTFFCGTNDLIRRLCPNSCNVCVRTTPEGGVATTAASGVCTDFDPQCPQLVGFCDRPDLLVNRLCRKSCNLCGTDITVPPKRDPLPLTCRVCVDPFCEREVESISRCPEDTPYCSSRVVNNADGTHGLTKRCASKSDCDYGWYAGKAAGNDTTCSNYDPNTIVQQEFICFFCCLTNECNRHAKPDPDTLYNGS